MNGVKTIFFKGTMNGNGIVNYNGGIPFEEEDFYTKSYGFKVPYVKHKKVTNIKVAKHVKEKIGDELKGKIIISSNCLRHSIFEKDMPNYIRSYRGKNEYLAKLIGHPGMLLRGYMETNSKKEKSNKKEKNTDNVEEVENVEDTEILKENDLLKRGNVVSVSHAIQSNNAFPSFLFNSNNGDKDNNAIFTIETVGEITYEYQGAINLQNLMFIDMDDRFGSMSLLPDNIDVFIASFKENTGLDIDKNTQAGYFYRTNQVEKAEQLGILLTIEQINYLIKYLFNNIASVMITRNNGYAKTSSLEYQGITNPTKNSNLFSSNDFIKLETTTDIEEIFIEPFPFYVKLRGLTE